MTDIFSRQFSPIALFFVQLKIKACMEATDCQPDFCLDLFEPSGHGRRKRTPGLLPGKNDTMDANDTNDANSTTEYTRFKENIEYTVIMPGEFDQLRGSDPDQCKNFVLISGLLAMLLAFSTILVTLISHRIHMNLNHCFRFNPSIFSHVR